MQNKPWTCYRNKALLLSGTLEPMTRMYLMGSDCAIEPGTGKWANSAMSPWKRWCSILFKVTYHETGLS